MADIPAAWGGWGPAIRDDPSGHFAEARARCPAQRVRLADDHPAWAVLGYDAARQVLNVLDPVINIADHFQLGGRSHRPSRWSDAP